MAKLVSPVHEELRSSMYQSSKSDVFEDKKFGPVAQWQIPFL